MTVAFHCVFLSCMRSETKRNSSELKISFLYLFTSHSWIVAALLTIEKLGCRTAKPLIVKYFLLNMCTMTKTWLSSVFWCTLQCILPHLILLCTHFKHDWVILGILISNRIDVLVLHDISFFSLFFWPCQNVLSGFSTHVNT